MSSAVSICSNALLALGAHPINSLEEATDYARTCANLYPVVRNDLLRRHPWKCAIKRVQLSPLSRAPAFGFGYQFPLPSDLIRVLSAGGVPAGLNYRIEGHHLLADVPLVQLSYVFRNEDEATWDATLVNLAEAVMAAKLAYPVTGSASLRDSLIQEAAYLLRQARAIEGQSEPPSQLDGFPTFEARF